MHIIRNATTLTYIEYAPSFVGLNVTEFGEEQNDSSSHSSALYYRNNHILHFVVEGKGSFTCDGRVYPLSAGKAFVITPKNLIRYAAEKGEAWTYRWISFAGTDCDLLYEQCGLSQNPVFDFAPEDIEPLNRLLDHIRTPSNLTENPVTMSLAASAMAFDVLRRLAKKLRGEPVKEPNKLSIIDSAVAYMKANLERPMNINALCKELSISRSYFSTMFQAAMEQSPYRYFQNLRIQRASELLLQDKYLRIYEVAEQTGFPTVAQFCKTFHKIAGMSPSEFRARYGAKR